MSFLPVPDVASFEDVTLNFEKIAQAGMFTGSGVPAFVAKKGNFYFRTDTPTTANQRIYVNTADGANWVGIL